MDDQAYRDWALFTVNGAALLWTLSFIAFAVSEAPTSLHHWPEMAGMVTFAVLGAGTAAFALFWAKNTRPYEICSVAALFGFAGAWLWLFGPSLV